MDVALLGTGPAEGLPVSGCTCARCDQAGRAGTARRPAMLSVTGSVLGPGPARPISAPDGTRLLWAAEPEPLPDTLLDSLRGADLDLALLGLPLDLAAAGHQLARLRAAGAVTDRTDVVLVGIGHRHLAPEQLTARISGWPARLVADGGVLGVRPEPVPRRTLVLGPAASGKSELAEHLLAAEPAVRYLATGPAAGSDPEWAERLAAHRARRAAWWRTIESPDVAAELGTGGPPVLLDALGTWLAVVLERAGAWSGAEGWATRTDAEGERLVEAWRASSGRVVAVGEEVGWGVVPESRAGRVFRDALGRLTRRLAEQSDQVLLAVAGQAVPLAEAGALGATRC